MDGSFANHRLSSDTITSSSSSLSVIPAWESPVCCCGSPMTHTLRVISQPLVLTLYGAFRTPFDYGTAMADRAYQKIRTIELDGKTVKLQIVCIPVIRFKLRTLIYMPVGYRRPRTIPDHHILLLPGSTWHLRRLRCDRYGFIQQRQAVASRN